VATNKQRRIGLPTSKKFGSLSSILALLFFIPCYAYYDLTIKDNKMTETELKEDYRFVYDKYFKTHKVDKVMGTDVDLRTLEDNESVMYGDGETFHFKMTKY